MTTAVPLTHFLVIQMKIPTEQDWEDWQGDLDTRYAYKMFFGKSLSDAVELFVDNALGRQEDLMWMPKTPFQFYLQAYKEYILSDRSENDSDGASCYLNLIKYKLEEESTQVTEIFETIVTSLEIVSKNQKYYDANIDIYGDFTQTFELIKEIYNNSK